MRAALLASLLVVAGALAWLLDVPGPSLDTGEFEPLRSPPPASADGADGDAGLEAFRAASEPVDAPLPAAVGEPVAEHAELVPATAVESRADVPRYVRDDRPLRKYVDPSLFEAFYEGATEEELLLAKRRLTARTHELTQAAAESHFAQGLAESRDYVATRLPGEPPPPIDLSPGQSGSKPSNGLVSSTRTEDLGNGTTMREESHIPWEGNESYYDLKDELVWLRRELRMIELGVEED